jgi:hypothetical protein
MVTVGTNDSSLLERAKDRHQCSLTDDSLFTAIAVTVRAKDHCRMDRAIGFIVFE